MLAKLTALLSGKAALTALGVVLVGGAATATTVAATTGHLGPIQTPHFGAEATKTPEANDAQGAHAHTVSIQGTLSAVVACPSNSTGAASAAASVTRLTLTNAKISAEHTEQDDATPTATKTPGAEGADAKSDTGLAAVADPIAVAVTKDTRVTGAGVHTLGDLCGQLKQRVEAQTTKSANGSYTAWKVTLLGGGQDGNGAGAAQEVTVQGTVKAIHPAASSITLATANGDVTVIVSAKTEFQGSVHALAQTKVGAHVTVHGVKQADGSVTASKIVFEADH